MIDDMNDLYSEMLKSGAGYYVWNEKEKRLVQVDLSHPLTIDNVVEEEDIPFCDGDCEKCEEYDEEMELDMEVEETDPCFWGIPDIRRIVYNPPATIVFWDDDTKTVVKCMEGEKFEKYAGFMAACMKKMFGSTSRAKAIMHECDQEEISARTAHKKEASKPKSETNGAKTKPKSLSLDDLIDAITYAIVATARHNHEKEKTNETPAE